MNCHEFERHLEDLLEGRLVPATRQICLDHTRRCAACAELLEATAGSTPDTVDPSLESLTAVVLEQTIGSACGEARERLPDFVDQQLESVDQHLMTLHLETCAACRELTDILLAMKQELPSLAEVGPDRQFTQEVLAATIPQPSVWRQWWTRQWENWVHRPRFAMEAAYVGLLVVMLVLGAFSTPVAALPQKGIELVQTDPATPSVWAQTGEGLGTFWDWIASLFEKVAKEETNEDSP